MIRDSTTKVTKDTKNSLYGVHYFVSFVFFVVEELWREGDCKWH
jgi:hypothetical protein